VARLLLDAGMGAALIETGLPGGALPEQWLLERPEEVERVHRAHAEAGAELLLTCSFNLSGPRLEEHALAGRLPEIAAAAVGLARSSAPGRRVAGAVGPSGLVAPGDGRPPPPAEMRSWYEPAFRALARAGADLLWVESHWHLDEARAALAAARSAGLPVAATMTPSAAEALPLPGGPDAAEWLAALAADGAVAVGVNCLLPGAPLSALAPIAAALPVPLVAKPSAGLPGRLLPPGPFAAWVAEAGAAWVGGCCGAGAAHLRALAAALRSGP